MSKRKPRAEGPVDERIRSVNIPIFQNDFLLIAEFCEQKGPVPLMTIPEKGSGAFDLQRFVVRILASDHTRKADPNKGGSGWMNPEDTQIYLTDNSQGAHAYVHHLTLHDVHARGYVRPFCICYITHEADKIMNNFESLLNAFTQISQVLKYGNNCRFVRDIQKQLSGISRIGIRQHLARQNDTKQQQSRFTENKSDDEEDYETDDTKVLDFLQEFPELTSDIFKQVLRDLNDLKKRFLAHMKDHGQQFDQNIADHIHVNMLASSPQIFSPLQNNSRNIHRSINRQLFKTPPKTSSSFISSTSFSFNNSEFLSLYDGGLSASSPNLQKYMPTVLKCIHKNTNFDEKLRDISQITGGLFETAHDMIYHILEHFHRPSLVLDMERYDLTHLNISPTLNTMLFIGKSFVFDFNMEMDHNNMQFFYQHWSPIGSTVLYPPNNNLSQPPESTMNSHAICNEKYSIYRNGFKGSGCYVSSIFDTSGNELQTSVNKWKRQRSNSAKGTSYNSSSMPPLQDLRTSHSLINSMISDFKNSNSVDIVPGRGVLDLRNHFSFAKELAYILLTGRLLVIHALPENENLVRNLMITCSLFVPGLLTSYQQRGTETEESCSSNTSTRLRSEICYWRIKSLGAIDLGRYKMIGMSKRATIPKSLENLISKLDLEEQTLYTNVQYKGQYLTQIFDRSKSWPDEATYISYIHSVFAEMGSKAALLYHLHSINGIKSHLSKSRSIPTAKAALTSDRTPSHANVTTPTTPAKNDPNILTETVIAQQTPSSQQNQVLTLIQQPPTPTSPTQGVSQTVAIQFNIPQRRISSGAAPPNTVTSPQRDRKVFRKKMPQSLKKKAPAFLNISSLLPMSQNNQMTAYELESFRDCAKPFLKQLGLRHQDANIIDYLVDVVKRQQYDELTMAPQQLILENNMSNCTMLTLSNDVRRANNKM